MQKNWSPDEVVAQEPGEEAVKEGRGLPHPRSPGAAEAGGTGGERKSHGSAVTAALSARGQAETQAGCFSSTAGTSWASCQPFPAVVSQAAVAVVCELPPAGHVNKPDSHVKGISKPLRAEGLACCFIGPRMASKGLLPALVGRASLALAEVEM